METLPVIAKRTFIVAFLMPVPDISIDGVVGAVIRFALYRIE